MFPNGPNGADKGKRKMSAGEGSGQQKINLLNVHGQQFAPPNLPLDSHFSSVQQILNNAAPKRPFSYMSLLTAPDEEVANAEPLFKDISNQRAKIDQLVSLHTENLKQALSGALGQHLHDVHRGAEERAAKRLKDRESELLVQNAQLQSMADHYKTQAERLVIRVRTLERTNRSLTERLDEANAARFYEETAQEEASSFPDPDRVEPITLECKICERKMATVMLWPCRHVCVCTLCDAGINFCPACNGMKTNSIEVHLPPN
ncbi:hypothetical protein ACS0TY_001203 [Phlomoides rotata]